MTPRAKRITILATLTVAFLGAAVWFYFAPHRAVGQIHQALAQGDTNSLSRHVDFVALRASLTAQVTTVVTNKIAQDTQDESLRGFAMLVARGVVKHLVETHISPSGLCDLLSGQAAVATKPTPKATAPDPAKLERAFGGASSSYESPSRFVLSMRGEKGETTRLVLVRNGLDWTLIDIKLP